MSYSKIKYYLTLFSLLFLYCNQSLALEIDKDALFVRIVDTGAGLATVTRMPGDYYMVYDAGHWHHKDKTLASISDAIPNGEEIDLLILSHNDSDHLGIVPQLFKKYKIKEVIWSGLERPQVRTWQKARDAINKARDANITTVYNLKHDTINFGSTFHYGETMLTFISGFYAPPDHWDIKGGKTSGEFRNAGSIVIRLSYKGKSILFTGDAVGRHSGDPDQNALIANEKFMVENADAIKIDSDILIAPHHGADNGSSTAFIKAVSPEWVIFSSGHEYGHPRSKVGKRYLKFGVSKDKIFRTDLEDDERGEPKGGDKEWDLGRKDGHHDKSHDDDIDILIKPNGEILVEYN
jgi:competence protein ComEC